MPQSGPIACTWDHGIEALETITNNSPGRTRKAWLDWYAANKHRSRLQWLADGFTAQGFPVSAEGGPESIRNLLKVLGTIPASGPRARTWLAKNAKLMLATWDPSQVREVVEETSQHGTPQEQQGAAKARETRRLIRNP